MTTIAILEDEQVMLESLRHVLDRAGLPVVHATTDPATFLACVRAAPSDVAIIDLKLEREDGSDAGSGIQILSDLRRLAPNTRCIVLSASRASLVVDECIAAGACAYLFKKSASTGAVVETIRAVARGEKVLPLMTLPGQLKPGAADPGPEPTPVAGLTQRELDVLRFVTSGADNKRIAAEHSVTERTVKAHLASLYRKLGVENRTQLALRARELGVIPFKL